jgi:hypothetical protein
VWKRGRSYQDDLEKHLLVNLHELLVPLVDVGGLLPVVGILGFGGSGIVAVVLAPLDDLLEHDFGDLVCESVSCLWTGDAMMKLRSVNTDHGDGNGLIWSALDTHVLEHVLDKNGLLSNGAV